MMNSYLLRLSDLKFENGYYKDRPSITKGTKAKQTEVQIPSSIKAYQGFFVNNISGYAKFFPVFFFKV